MVLAHLTAPHTVGGSCQREPGLGAFLGVFLSTGPVSDGSAPAPPPAPPPGTLECALAASLLPVTGVYVL